MAVPSRGISAIGFPGHWDQVCNKPVTNDGSPIWSSDVKCVLAEEKEDADVANLVGYATMTSLLQYTVGRDTCLAHISAARCSRADSSDKRLTPTIDFLQKIRAKDINQVTEALRIESAMALATRQTICQTQQ